MNNEYNLVLELIRRINEENKENEENETGK